MTDKETIDRLEWRDGHTGRARIRLRAALKTVRDCVVEGRTIEPSLIHDIETVLRIDKEAEPGPGPSRLVDNAGNDIPLVTPAWTHQQIDYAFFRADKAWASVFWETLRGGSP